MSSIALIADKMDHHPNWWNCYSNIDIALNTHDCKGVSIKDIMLAFVKPNKTCMMVITDGVLGKTELTLYVAIDKTTSGGTNPFGEAVSR